MATERLTSKMQFEPFECVICSEQIENTPSCSAHPIINGKCCPRCDDLVVNTVRICLSQGCSHILHTVRQAIMMHNKVLELRKQPRSIDVPEDIPSTYTED